MRLNRTFAASVIGAFAAISTSAHAVLPAGFSGAVAQYQADTVEAVGMLMAAGIVIWGVLKLKSKLGL